MITDNRLAQFLKAKTERIFFDDYNQYKNQINNLNFNIIK